MFPTKHAVNCQGVAWTDAEMSGDWEPDPCSCVTFVAFNTGGVRPMSSYLSRSTFIRTTFVLAIGTLVLVPLSALADTVMYKAEMKGGSETPPTTSTGTGTVTATFDTATKMLTWKGDYTGLSGPATAAHFHGPADVGQAAGVQVPIKPFTSPFDGSATLTDAQNSDLAAGKWYVNVHTEANPKGEIRGQLVKQ